MKIKRWFARKINLGNYETIDIGCEFEIEKDEKLLSGMASQLHKQAKREVEKSTSEFQSKILRDNLEARVKVVGDELLVLKRHPKENERKINVAKFELGLFQDELNWLTKPAKKNVKFKRNIRRGKS